MDCWLLFSSERGPIIEGNPVARDKALKFSKFFMLKHLLGKKIMNINPN